jgi:hypothetical protein
MNLVIACSFWFWSIEISQTTHGPGLSFWAMCCYLERRLSFFCHTDVFVLWFLDSLPLGFHDLFWTLENFGKGPIGFTAPGSARFFTVLPFSMMLVAGYDVFRWFEVEMLALTAAVSLVFWHLVWIWSSA